MSFKKLLVFLLLIFLSLLFVGSLYALEINTTYSGKDFMNQDFSEVDASDFNNTIIQGSCFYQELPKEYSGNPFGVTIFPATMTGVIFVDCNLNNVRVIGTNTIQGGTNKKIRVQNDGNDWEVSNTGAPVRPNDEALYDAYGLSKDPDDLPEQARVGESVTQQAEREVLEVP